jgi:hypothetical protein
MLVNAGVLRRAATLQGLNHSRMVLNSQQKSTPLHVIHMVKKCRTPVAATRCVEMRTKT